MRTFLNHYRLKSALQGACSAEMIRSINEELGLLLTHFGFVREGNLGLRYVSRAASALKTDPNIAEHLCWSWDLEWHSGSCWLVPLAQRRFLSAAPASSQFARTWIDRACPLGRPALQLNAGTRSRLRAFGDRIRVLERKAWAPCNPSQWHLSFSMADLRILGCSEEAFRRARQNFRGLHDLICASRFKDVIETVARPFEVPSAETDRIGGNRLEFALGLGSRPADVRRLKVLRPPKHSRFIVAAPHRRSLSHPRQLSSVLRVHLLPRSRLERSKGGRESLQELKSKGKNIRLVEVWEQMGLPPLELAAALEYDPETGILMNDGKRHLESVLREYPGNSQVVLLILAESMGGAEIRQLRTNFQGLPLSQLRLDTLVPQGWPVFNLAQSLAQKAGARVYALAGMPTADGSTVFLGVDLGHDHRRDRTKVGLVLVDPHGQVRDSKSVLCSKNDERIPPDVIREVIPEFVTNRYPEPKRIIVHRDGRFLKGEKEDLTLALSFASLSLVAVKKAPRTRFWSEGRQFDGAWFSVSANRAIVITTDGETQRGGIPAPLEIELVLPGDLTLAHATEQVFWLCRSPLGIHRLPSTTRLADALAATGKRSGHGEKTISR